VEARRVEARRVGGDESEECAEWGPPSGGHGYELGVVCLFVRLVMAGVSLRGAPRVLELVAAAWGLPLEVPHWTTGRLWLLRLGHFLLTRPLERARDWAWLVDHSVQVGKQKVLVILGVRLKDLPSPGQCLRHRDLRLVALEPRESWTRQEVFEALERAAARTGVPRAIADDHAVDLSGGASLFQQCHPETAECYDVKHKAACLLKGRLEKLPQWQEFQGRVAQTRCAVQQTELAFLAPPSPRPKARFMNLGPLLVWAGHVLELLRRPEAVARWATPQRLAEKLGWARSFAADLTEWSRWQRVVDVTVEFVGRQGLSIGAADALGAELSRLDEGGGEARRLAEELEDFVRDQEAAADLGERLPGSTEVLESCFGKFKHLEKQQSRGGFTGLVLALGAMLCDATAELAHEALEHSHTKDVSEWCKQHLGTTLFAQRRAAYAAGATEVG
jgi:hypothetical protein